MKRLITLSAILSVFAFIVSCTDFQEAEVPEGLTVNEEQLDFPSQIESRSLTVRSGAKWAVPSLPEWIDVQSIDRSGSSPYEWTITFTAWTNSDFNRSGLIILATNAVRKTVFVNQQGPKGEYVALESISISGKDLVLQTGDSFPLTVTFNPQNASIQDLEWSSDNTSVATVSPAGLVTAIAPGTATITVKTSDGGKTATCTVTVQQKVIPVTGVSLDRTSLTLVEGDSQTLTATVVPANATNTAVAWSSSNTSVATVSSSGLVTAITPGTTTITVKTSDGGKTATCTVTVQQRIIPVTGVSLDRTTLTLVEGDSQTLNATVAPANATNTAVTWSSNNTSVATVSSAGLVTAILPGTATITAKTNDGGKTASCVVTVQQRIIPVTGVSLDRTTLNMVIGNTDALTATIYPSNATNKGVKWYSNDPSVVTVSQSGVVKAVKLGRATIYVVPDDGGESASCEVYVRSHMSIQAQDHMLIENEPMEDILAYLHNFISNYDGGVTSLSIETEYALRNNFRSESPEEWGLISSVSPTMRISVGRYENGTFTEFSLSKGVYTVPFKELSDLNDICLQFNDSSPQTAVFSVRVPVVVNYAGGSYSLDFQINFQITKSSNLDGSGNEDTGEEDLF